MIFQWNWQELVTLFSMELVSTCCGQYRSGKHPSLLTQAPIALLNFSIIFWSLSTKKAYRLSSMLQADVNRDLVIVFTWKHSFCISFTLVKNTGDFPIRVPLSDPSPLSLRGSCSWHAAAAARGVWPQRAQVTGWQWGREQGHWSFAAVCKGADSGCATALKSVQTYIAYRSPQQQHMHSQPFVCHCMVCKEIGMHAGVSPVAW